MGLFSFGKKEEILDDPDEDMEELNSLFEFDSSVFQEIDENEDAVLSGLNENTGKQPSSEQPFRTNTEDSGEQCPETATGQDVLTGSQENDTTAVYHDQNKLAVMLNNKGVVLGRMGKYEAVQRR